MKRSFFNEAGLRALSAGMPGAAERLFERAVAAEPSGISGYVNLAGLRLRRGARTEALRALNAARKACPPAQLAAAAAELDRLEAGALPPGAGRLLLADLSNTFESRLFALDLAEFFFGAAAADLALPRPACFAGLEPDPGLYRRRFSGPRSPAAGESYDAILYSGFPAEEHYGWFRELLALPARRKVFVNLHLSQRPGHSAVSDALARDKALACMDRAFILDNDSFAANLKYGLARAVSEKYLFSVNARYYAPVPGPEGKRLVSAGNSARDYAALLRAAEGTGNEVLIFTDLELPAPLPPRVSVRRLHGAQEALRRELGRAKAVVVPFRPDLNPGVNSVLTMGMAMGKTVLTGDSPVIRRLVRDGENALLYDSASPDGLAGGLRRLLALGPARRKALGRKARETVLAGADYRLLLARLAPRLGVRVKRRPAGDTGRSSRYA